MKLEEEDTDLKFGSDGWLREFVEMETTEEAKPVVKLEETVTSSSYFDKEYQKIDKEDTYILVVIAGSRMLLRWRKRKKIRSKTLN